MAEIVPGRWTHRHDGDVVVFLIGMRINRLRSVRSWWPAAQGMPAMLRELYADPSLGLLSHTLHVGWRSVTVVQYWRDLDSLISYAQASDHVHRPAWTAFYRRAHAAAGAVGIWHETLSTPAGRHESLYVDMPRQGLPAAWDAVAAGGRRDTARGRLAATTD